MQTVRTYKQLWVGEKAEYTSQMGELLNEIVNLLCSARMFSVKDEKFNFMLAIYFQFQKMKETTFLFTLHFLLLQIINIKYNKIKSNFI